MILTPMAFPARSTKELVGEARRGDRHAYAVLYERFRGAVNAVILARVPPADRADLVQDTFIAAWTKLDELREDAAFGGWIVESARRRAVSHLRNRRTREGLRGADAGAERVFVDPVPRAEALEAMAAIRTLPEAYQETLIMRLVEGMSGPEIADATGLTPESVRVNLCRGMKMLRAHLGEGEIGSST